MKIEIENLDEFRKSLIEQAAYLIFERSGLEAIEERVREIAEERVKDKLDEIAESALAPLVAEVIATGWPRTNSYGEPVGNRIGVRERIGELLGVGRRDGRSGDWLDQRLHEALNGEFKKEIEAARAKFRAALDEALTAKLRDTLREALGLR